MPEIDRRDFLKYLGVSALGAVSPPLPKVDIFATLGKLKEVFLPLIIKERLPYYRQEFEEQIKPVFLKNRENIVKLRPNGALGDLDVLRMYYPIYRSAQDRFNVPWFLLWMIHDAESTCSQDKNAFITPPVLDQYGAMQREINYYPQSKVEEAAKGFEYLSGLEQFRPDDWKEILWAASKLDRDAQNAQNLYPLKDRNWTLGDALYAYCRQDEAERRIERFKTLLSIFAQDTISR